MTSDMITWINKEWIDISLGEQAYQNYAIPIEMVIKKNKNKTLFVFFIHTGKKKLIKNTMKNIMQINVFPFTELLKKYVANFG